MFAAHTSESRTRSLRDRKFGLGPLVAEMLKSKGHDPETYANELRERQTERARRRAPQSLSLPRPKDALPLSLDPSDVTIRTLLNETAMQAWEDDFIQDVLAPVQPVDLRSGTAYVSSRLADRAQVDDVLGEKARATRVPSGLSTVTYDCKPYGLESDVNEQLAGEHPLLENVSNETRRLGALANLQEELRVASAISTTSNYASTCVNTLGSGYQWNGGASADAVADMHGALAAMIVMPTHYAIGLEGWQAMQRNDDLRAIVLSHPNNNALMSYDDFGMYFGIPNAEVNRGQYAAVGATTMSRIYSTTDLALLHVDGNPKMRTFLRRYRLRQGANGILTSTWFDRAVGVAGFTFVKVAHQTVSVVVDNAYGALIKNVRR